jgi:TonB-dependent starch-binding outer membrane protein SusC
MQTFTNHLNNIIMEKTILLMFRRLLRGTYLSRSALLVFVFAASAASAQVTVKGKVTDETGSGMPGVNVLVKGTTNGTTTDGGGGYSISVENSSNATLIFSFIGYATIEEAIGGRTSIDVNLIPSIESLNEVLVVGYGTQKKSDITGAVARVTGESLREVPVSNFTQSLQGRAAGVEINSTSSRPGANAQIRIRGSRSFSASNDPLIVLDGIPFNGSINDVNVNDIAAIDVLKDASATAIYGSRGSNGVIIVSTKKGATGKAQVFYNGYYGVSSAIGKYDVYNGAEFEAFRTEARRDGGASYPTTPDEAANIAAGNQTDWQDLMYENGYITDHNVGVAGGTDETKFLISTGYFKQTTILPGQAFSRFSVTGAIDQKVGERIKIGLNTMNQFNINDGEDASAMFSILTLSPLYNAYNADGTINTSPAVGSNNPETLNPLLIYNDQTWKQQRRRLRTFNSLYGEVQILEGLKYRINVGLDLFQDNYGRYDGSGTPYKNGGTNEATIQNTNSWSYTVENLVTYEKTFAEQHRLTLTGLYSIQETEEFRSGANANTLPADYTYYYNLGLGNVTSVPSGASYYSKSSLLSYMGRANYAFSDRYLLTLSYRADGSSRLADGNKWFYYPAAAVAWNIKNESFMSGLKSVSSLKLRFGWGKTSNQSVNTYASLGSLAAEPYNYGTSGLYGYYVSSLPNPELRWEFTTTTNLGIDFGLLNNRLSGSLEYYQQKTEDILQSVSLPQTSGVGSVVKNVGESENKGLELTLSSVNIESSNGFTWNTDLNIFLNRGEITYLAGGVSRNITNGWHVGYPIDAIYDYEKIGIVQTGETGLPTGFDPGDIKIKDQLTVDTNGDGVFDATDGVINASDRVVLGSGQAKWSGGLTNRIAFKGFDFSFVLFWKIGGTLVSNFYQANISNPINSLEGRRNGPQVDYWTPENPTNAYPRPGRGQIPDYGSTLGYFDASYLKVRSINLGYSFPQNFMGKTGISSLRVYAQVLNPFQALFSDYVKAGGLDPETNGFGGSVTEGYGPNNTNRLTVNPNTPPTRSIIFGINLKY